MTGSLLGGESLDRTHVELDELVKIDGAVPWVRSDCNADAVRGRSASANEAEAENVG